MIPLGFFNGKHNNVYNNHQAAIEYCSVSIQKILWNRGNYLHKLKEFFLK